MDASKKEEPSSDAESSLDSKMFDHHTEDLHVGDCIRHTTDLGRHCREDFVESQILGIHPDASDGFKLVLDRGAVIRDWTLVLRVEKAGNEFKAKGKFMPLVETDENSR